MRSDRGQALLLQMVDPITKYYKEFSVVGCSNAQLVSYTCRCEAPRRPASSAG